MRKLGITIVILILLIARTTDAQKLIKKKMIEFGADVPTPAFVRDHIREMEARPLDGIIFNTSDYNHIFETRQWTAEMWKAELEALAAIRWQRFTDNFITLYTADRGKIDWFNDSQWSVIESNMRLFSKAAVAGECAGICFDQEPYGDNPWLFSGRFPGKNFDEVAKQARRRGRQFMAAIQSAMPKVKLLNFFQLGYLINIMRTTCFSLPTVI